VVIVFRQSLAATRNLFSALLADRMTPITISLFFGFMRQGNPARGHGVIYA